MDESAVLSYTSSAHNFTAQLSSIKWQLHHNVLLRISKKHGKLAYNYANIESIRLCYHIGGRSSHNKYCCYFKTNDQWDNLQIFSCYNADTTTENYKTYHTFVDALIINVSRKNSMLVLIAGHSFSSWFLYLMTCLLLLSLPLFTYQYHISSFNESLWMGTIMLLLISPMLISMVKYFPKKVKLNQIPENVLPKPKTEH